MSINTGLRHCRQVLLPWTKRSRVGDQYVLFSLVGICSNLKPKALMLMFRLLLNSSVTNRRVNALENVTIPKIEGILDYIARELDELEREGTFWVCTSIGSLSPFPLHRHQLT